MGRTIPMPDANTSKHGLVQPVVGMKKLMLFFVFTAISASSMFLLLCLDDSDVLVPTNIEAYAAQPEGSEESFGILLKALKQEIPYQETPLDLSRKKKDEEGYQDLLIENRDLIILNYAQAQAPLNELKPLNGFEEIGDTSISYDSETVNFRSIRDMLNAVCLYTELSYIEDSSEKSLDDLLQIHSIGAKWLQNTRTLVHCMIGIVALNQIRDTLSMIAPHLNPDEVQQVLKAYSNAPDFPRAIETALYSEYCMAAYTLDGILSEGKAGLSYLLFKRNKTLNIYGTYLEEQIASSRRQDWKSMSERSDALEEAFDRFHPTNWGGWTFLAMAVPGMKNVIKKAYEAESKDLELIKKLHP